ncbi:MAG: Gfo/Idh/MocA family protein [Bacteroides sp.]
MKHVLNLIHKPIPVIKIGIIGVGNRGLATLKRYMDLDLEGIEFIGLSDLDPSNLDQAQAILKAHQLAPAQTYCSSTGWMKLCEHPDINLILICTDWLSHAPIGVYAMEQGKHVAIEVPIAITVDECWQLVETAERTQRHCTMLENCCYDPFTLTINNMVKQGVLGDISHVEGAYIHDLRAEHFKSQKEGGFHNNWNQKYCMEHTGNPYPTHGLGPLCQLLDIHRSDRLKSLVSLSSQQKGMQEFAQATFGPDSPEAQLQYKVGDMNTTLIQTENNKTILLQYGISLPRPYSRLFTVCGTKGFAQKYPIPTLSLAPQGDTPLPQEEVEQLLQKYEHPFVSQIGKPAQKAGIQNSMNYMMDYRLIYCLQQGLPLDIDVYDAVEWSCIAELSEQSVLNAGKPIEIPNFLRKR